MWACFSHKGPRITCKASWIPWNSEDFLIKIEVVSARNKEDESSCGFLTEKWSRALSHMNRETDKINHLSQTPEWFEIKKRGHVKGPEDYLDRGSPIPVIEIYCPAALDASLLQHIWIKWITHHQAIAKRDGMLKR